MEVITVADSSIALMTLDRTMGKGKQEHKIRWVPLEGCPDGYIIQRITRDTKTTRGREKTDGFGMPTGSVTWERATVTRADYFEMWEVWQGSVYPSKSAATSTGMFNSHAGLKDKAWFGDRYKDPAATAAAAPTRARGNTVVVAPSNAVVAASDEFHDVFSDTVRDCASGERVKGTNKILGKVFFLPRDSKEAAGYLAKYLKGGRRNLVWANTYTGGILLQFDAANIPEPDKRFLQITRYEAIEFKGDSKNKTIHDRGYPGIMRKKGQGVVNAQNANMMYRAGTCVGPAGLPPT